MTTGDAARAVPAAPDVDRMAGVGTARPADPAERSGGGRPGGTASERPAVPPASGPLGVTAGGQPGEPAWQTRYLSLLIAADLLVGFGAAGLAFQARFGTASTPHTRSYLLLSVLLPLAFVAALAANRAYERRYLFVGTEEYQRVIRAGLTLTATMAIISYGLEVRLSRGYVVLALPMATLACLTVRWLLRRQLYLARERGNCLRRVLVVGHPTALVAITNQLRRERFHGLDVIAGCVPNRRDRIELVGGVNLPIVGDFTDLARAVAVARADTVLVLSCPELDGHALRRLAWQVENHDVELIVASTLIDVAGARTTIRPVDGLPMMHVEHPTLVGARRVVKKVFDLVGAAVLVALLAPVLAAIAVAIRIDSPGPVLFRQTRVGKAGRQFTILKFRSMAIDAHVRLAGLRSRNDCDGVLFKLRHDPRVTRVGRLLRRFSLDELPQLFNVLFGQMSLVGPRPPLPEEVATYPTDLHRRLAVKPGLTGLWQVSGRSDLPWAEAIRLDLRYVENWTLTLDLLILLRTLAAVVRASGAY